jgi:hypothetical protein
MGGVGVLTRRNFLRGLLSSLAAAAVAKNGVVQLKEPDYWCGADWAKEPDKTSIVVFDMAANTWQVKVQKFGAPIQISDELLADSDSLGGFLIPSDMSKLLLEAFDGWAEMTHLPQKTRITMRHAIRDEWLDVAGGTYPPLDNYGISHDTVAKRIELVTRTERTIAHRNAVLEEARRKLGRSL